MTDLRSFVLLQARVYEFLAQQNETTLQAIVSGGIRLAVGHADDTVTPGSFALRDDAHIAHHAGPTDLMPSRDPLRAAHDLSTLTSEPERRSYLNAAEFSVKDLQKMAKMLGLRRYSKLTRAELVNLLVSHHSGRTDVSTDEPGTPVATSSRPIDSDSAGKQQTTAEVTPDSAGTAKPVVDAAAIASRLRETETEEDGAAYLRAQDLDQENLLAVAAELLLTRVERLSRSELEKRVLKQAIGARRKFAGLRKW